MTRGVFVGVDVAKDRLDVAFRPSGEKLTVQNDRREIIRLVRTVSRLTPECVVLEASGGYERRLLERLAEEELPVALVNPRNIREFARASGRLAKTDAIDATVLAHFAEVMKPELRRLPDPETRRLRALITRRNQLVRMMTAEQNRQFAGAREFTRRTSRDHSMPEEADSSTGQAARSADPGDAGVSSKGRAAA